MKKGILLDFIKIKDWTKVWSGRWSLQFNSHIGNDWTKNIKILGNPVFRRIIYVYKNGITDCWVSQAEKDFLGKRLRSLAFGKVDRTAFFAAELKRLADEVTHFLKAHDPQKALPKEIREYWNLIGRYYLPLIRVKYLVDYLTPVELKKSLNKLEEARLYSEPIFRNTENFFEKLAETIAKQNKFSQSLILALTAKELENYYQTSRLPDRRELKKRFARSALIVKQAHQQLFVGKAVDQIEAILVKVSAGNTIKGQTAYQGVARGVARIVLNPKNRSTFNKGDILVTGMTRPEFLILMKKAGAIVTDAGGILSHAAITARELKKPCVIGTKISTKVFKDGDQIEVDANKGTISKIK
jgi:phosphohistidine swiveling domain-containing protein